MTFPFTGEMLATATAPGSTGTASIALRPPAGDPAAVGGVVTLPDVELAVEGTWNAATGTAPLSRATFESILAAGADPEVDQAPVHFGHFDPRFPHLSDGEPAVGWVRPTRIEQRPDGRSVLMGNITDVPASLVQVIRSGYKRRSIEFATGLTTPSGRSYPAAMTGLGLLGVRAPAVKGLADLAQRYLSAPTVAATVPLQAVLVEDAASDTPAAGGWFPVAGVAAGHDGLVYRRPDTGEINMATTRFTDQRIRDLLALSATDDVTALQQTIAQLPSSQPAQPAAAAQPQPPAGYLIPPGYAPVGTAQPAAAAQPQPAAQQLFGQPAPVAQPAAAPAQPYFQPVQPQPAAATVGAQPAPAAPYYLQSAPAAAQQPVYYQPAPAAQPVQPQLAPAGYPYPAPQLPVYAPPAQPAYQPAPVQPAAQPQPYPGTGYPAPAQPQPFAQPAQQQPVYAPPGQVAASAGVPAAPAGSVLMSADQVAGLGRMVEEHTRNRRDVTAWQAFSTGKISAAEYPGIRAELDRDEGAATQLLGLLSPGRYPVQAFGAAGGTGVNAPVEESAYAAFEATIGGRPVAQPTQQAPAGAAQQIGL